MGSRTSILPGDIWGAEGSARTLSHQGRANGTPPYTVSFHRGSGAGERPGQQGVVRGAALGRGRGPRRHDKLLPATGLLLERRGLRVKRAGRGGQRT